MPIGTIFLSPPAAWRATLFSWSMLPTTPISIHALREEGDQSPSSAAQWTTYFYPRPPRGGRPKRQWPRPTARTISIHALREEGDRNAVHRSSRCRNFYPRPPRGGRPLKYYFCQVFYYFCPRPPRGGRPVVLDLPDAETDFYPRPPRGGRLNPAR